MTSNLLGKVVVGKAFLSLNERLRQKFPKRGGKIPMMLNKRKSKWRPKRRSLSSLRTSGTYSSFSRKRGGGPVLFIIAALFLLAAVVLTIISYSRYKAVAVVYPHGSKIADIPVGGLSRDAAEERLKEAFGIPVELVYRDARVQLTPEALGFDPLIEETLNQADGQMAHQKWSAYLWGKEEQAPAFSMSLQSHQNYDAIRQTLQATFANRYDQAATASVPMVTSAQVQVGEPGLEMVNIDETITRIGTALASPNQRVVHLEVAETPALPVSWQNLETKLRQTILEEGFNGLVEIYLQDLQDSQLMHFASRGGTEMAVDVAYSAASTVKIPIMLSTMRRLSDPHPVLALNWMRSMIKDSLNPPADGLMKNYMDNNLGPLKVTDDLQELGYQNTFMAGFFEPGSPLLRKYETAANKRTDINLNPDVYNQTVPSEIGDLLARIYRCAKNDAPEYTFFGGQVTQAECQIMIDNLLSNRMGALIEVGTGIEGRVAHKHGWTNETDGLLHTISDVGIVYSPGGDYVLVIFIHSSQQLLFDAGNLLFARLSQSIYNAYNPYQQAIVYTD